MTPKKNNDSVSSLTSSESTSSAKNIPAAIVRKVRLNFYFAIFDIKATATDDIIVYSGIIQGKRCQQLYDGTDAIIMIF